MTAKKVKKLPSASYAVHSTHIKPLGVMDFKYNLKF
jgi:hypothetical protein